MVSAKNAVLAAAGLCASDIPQLVQGTRMQHGDKGATAAVVPDGGTTLAEALQNEQETAPQAPTAGRGQGILPKRKGPLESMWFYYHFIHLPIFGTEKLGFEVRCWFRKGGTWQGLALALVVLAVGTIVASAFALGGAWNPAVLLGLSVVATKILLGFLIWYAALFVVGVANFMERFGIMERDLSS